MYSLEVRESVDRIFSKLAKKDPKKMRIINKVVVIEDYDHHDKIYLL